MLLACWSCKGGSGTTVVASALACLLVGRSPDGVLLVDLAGDVAATLGMGEIARPGVAEWLAAGEGTPVDALHRLEVDAPGGVRLLPAGDPGGMVAAERADVLAAVLAADRRVVVADCGTGPTGAALAVARTATASLLVIRPCIVALGRVGRTAVRPTGVIVVREPGRALAAADVEAVAGAPVLAEVRVGDEVARAVDAGILARRLPRTLQRSLRHVV